MSRLLSRLATAVLVVVLALTVVAPLASASIDPRPPTTFGWWGLKSGTTQSLFAVDFATYAKGWAVGANGTILRTTDWGAHWKKQTSGTTEHLWSVCAVTGRQAWAAGTDGEIVYTFDGGAKWYHQASFSAQDLASICFVGPDQGFAVGGDGNDAVLSTADGGGLWTTGHTGFTGWYSDINSPDGSHVWIVGTSGTILRSTNGGSTWASQASGTGAALSAVEWASASWLWAVGSGGTILRTTNGGSNWDGMVSGTSANLFDIDTADGSDLWAVGADGTIRTSNDAGLMWHAQYADFGGFVRSVSAVSPFVGYAVGDGGTILRTASMGETDVTRPISKALVDVSVLRNRKATLKYRISDYMPGCAAATVTVKIKKLNGTVVKAFAPVIQLSNVARAKTFKCTLPKGTYRYYAYATDLSGNKASKVTPRSLVVK